jgi:membrane-bound lytic murein transglycosylase F
MTISAINRILFEKTGFVITVFFCWILAVLYFVYPFVRSHQFITLHKILKTGQLNVITSNSAHSYYSYRDQPMGFEFELAKAYAEYLGVRLQLKIVDSWESMTRALKDGSGALLAAGIIITPEREKLVSFSKGYMKIDSHIITHRNNMRINRVEHLAGKSIHITEGSLNHDKLKELRRQHLDLMIVAHQNLSAEELIQKVDAGAIEITIADSHIASLNQQHYPGAAAKGVICDGQQLGWAVNPKAQKLLASINAFFDTIKENGKFDEIYNKYYGQNADFDYVDLRAFHRRLKSRLSRYSPFIKAAAERHDFDWRLIVAQIYQESHLNPWAKSRAGAKGLMQLLPSTAKSLGVKDIYNPVENINAGVQYLKNLYEHFDIAEKEDRLLIALAAYNIGQGHIGDARKLARKLNLDPDRWSSLAKALPMLRYKKYYQKSKYGYCRGNEPVQYIKQIMIYYEILKSQGIEYGVIQAGG